MNYKRILSIYNSLHETYSVLVKNNPEGLSLDWISTINTPFEFDENDINFNENSISEFRSQFEDIQDRVDGVSIVFPAENIMVSQFPINADVAEEDVKSLLDIEIKKAYPKLDINDFAIDTIKLGNESNQQQKIMCIILPKLDIIRYEEFFSKYNKKIIATYVSQIAAANSFIYNYPELRSSVSVIVGIQGNFLDFTIVKNSKIIYYNLLSYQQNSDIPQSLTNEISKIKSIIDNSIMAGVFCYGEDLNEQLFREIEATLKDNAINTYKLNAFRMMRTNFNDREIDYCKRVSHIFPSVIGASFPSFFNSQTL